MGKNTTPPKVQTNSFLKWSHQGKEWPLQLQPMLESSKLTRKPPYTRSLYLWYFRSRSRWCPTVDKLVEPSNRRFPASRFSFHSLNFGGPYLFLQGSLGHCLSLWRRWRRNPYSCAGSLPKFLRFPSQFLGFNLLSKSLNRLIAWSMNIMSLFPSVTEFADLVVDNDDFVS